VDLNASAISGLSARPGEARSRCAGQAEAGDRRADALADLDRRIDESKKTEETAAADEARDRDNLTALKGNDAAKRFVDELNRAEDQLQATRKQTADLEQQKQLAEAKLNALIAGLSFDWDVTSKGRIPRRVCGLPSFEDRRF
jgi:hypothetical protein